MSNSSLKGADFRAADLTGTIFYGSDLRFANLRYTKLEESNFENVLLDSATVKEKNWIQLLEEKDVVGHKEINEKYRMDGPYYNIMREHVYLIVKKENPEEKLKNR